MKKFNVRNFLNSIGINKTDFNDFNEFISNNKDLDLTDEIIKLHDDINPLVNRANPSYYDLKNESIELAKAITSFTSYDFLVKSSKYLCAYEEFLTGEVLEVGCDIGITSCLLATIRPDLHFTCIDMSKNSISVAEGIKAELGLSNITFIHKALKDLVSDIESGNLNRFDTIVSVDVLLDSAKPAEYDPFLLLDQSSDEAAESLFDYAENLSKAVKENGNIISIENIAAPDLSLAWMKALNKFNIVISPLYTKRYTYEIGDIVTNIGAFIFKKDKKVDIATISSLYYDTFLSDPQFESDIVFGEAAVALFDKSLQYTIDGIDVISKEGKPTARYCVCISKLRNDILNYIMVIDGFGNCKSILHYSEFDQVDNMKSLIEKSADEFMSLGYTVIETSLIKKNIENFLNR